MGFGEPYLEGAFLHTDAVALQYTRDPASFTVIRHVVYAKIKAATVHGRPEWCKRRALASPQTGGLRILHKRKRRKRRKHLSRRKARSAGT